RTDNQVLAQATLNLANAFAAINEQYPGSDTLRKMLLKLLLKFAGEQQDDDVLQAIMDEAGEVRPQEQRVGANGYARSLNAASIN
ncbi:MAG: hypothetical protein AB8I52_04560, partial [Candidatus Promineifilaceae bacterium]